MSAHTDTGPLYRTKAEAIALARDLATPEALQLFLQALRARHERRGLPLPVPSLPIEIINPS